MDLSTLRVVVFDSGFMRPLVVADRTAVNWVLSYHFPWWNRKLCPLSPHPARSSDLSAFRCKASTLAVRDTA